VQEFSPLLVYASEKYIGFGIKHLHTAQEIARVKDILTHVVRRSTMGNLYRTSFELLLVKLGLGPDIHTAPDEMLDSIATES
jgi:hypothetical protein